MLDIEAFGAREDFAARILHLIEEVKSVPTPVGVDEVYFPGEIENRSLQNASSLGVTLAERTVDEVRALAVALGVEPL